MLSLLQRLGKKGKKEEAKHDDLFPAERNWGCDCVAVCVSQMQQLLLRCKGNEQDPLALSLFLFRAAANESTLTSKGILHSVRPVFGSFASTFFVSHLSHHV